MAVPEAVAGLAAIPGVRTAAQLGEPNLDASASAGSLPVAPALAKLVPGGLRRGTALSVSGSAALVLAPARNVEKSREKQKQVSPEFDDYEARTDRLIPMMLLERRL